MGIKNRLARLIFSGLREEYIHKGAEAIATAVKEFGFDKKTSTTLIQRVGLSMVRAGAANMLGERSADQVAKAVSGRAQGYDADTRMPDDVSLRGLASDTPYTGGLYSWYQRQLRSKSTRMATYRDVDLMNSECPELGRAIDVTANNIVSNDEEEKSFEYGAEDKNIKRVLDELMTRIKLQEEVRDHCWEMLQKGDVFLAKVVDSDGLIWKLKYLSPYSMYRIETDQGRLVGYEQRDMIGKLIAKWEPWEMLHLRNDPPLGSTYGKSMLWRARKVYRQLNLLEDGLVVMVLTRAAQKLVHKVPIPDAGERGLQVLKEYKRQSKRRVEYDTTSGTFIGDWNPLNDGDVYVGVNEAFPNAGIETLDGQTNFDQVVKALEYFQDKLLVNTGVPPSYLGIERNVNAKATLTQEEIEFARSLRRKQQYLASKYKNEVMALQLFLAFNMKIEPDAYYIQFPQLSKADERVKAEIRKMDAEAMKILGEQAIPIDVVLTKFFNWDELDAKYIAQSMGMQPTQKENKTYSGDLLQRVRNEMVANDELRKVYDLLADAASCVMELKDPVRV